MITIGDVLPNLTLPATGNQKIHLPSLAGRPLILYFYPKDDTPGCTQEGQDFRDHYNTFQMLNTLILGVSRDRNLKRPINFLLTCSRTKRDNLVNGLKCSNPKVGLAKR